MSFVVKRFLRAIALGASAVALCISLAGCGTNDKQAVEDTAKSTLEAIKSGSGEGSDTYLGAICINYGELKNQYDFSAVKEALLDSFECSIDGIEVDGDKARVAITYKTIPSSVVCDLERAVAIRVTGESAYPTNSWSDSVPIDQAVNELANGLSKVTPEERTRTIGLEKFNGKWDVRDGAFAGMSSEKAFAYSLVSPQ